MRARKCRMAATVGETRLIFTVDSTRANLLLASDTLRRIVPGSSLTTIGVEELGGSEYGEVRFEFPHGIDSTRIECSASEFANVFFYCYLSPILAAAITHESMALVDASSFATPDGAGILLAGDGKTSSLHALCTSAPWVRAVSEDSCVIDRFGRIIGTQSPLRLRGDGLQRDRVNVELPSDRWADAAALRYIVRLHPSDDPPRFWSAGTVDGGAWITQLFSGRPLGYGLLNTTSNQMISSVCAKLISWDHLSQKIAETRKSVRVFGLSGGLSDRTAMLRDWAEHL